MNCNKYTPSNFPERFEMDGITVEYTDLKEIQMGSPLIGRLFVNGVPPFPDTLAGHLCFPDSKSTHRVFLPGSVNSNFAESRRQHEK